MASGDWSKVSARVGRARPESGQAIVWLERARRSIRAIGETRSAWDRAAASRSPQNPVDRGLSAVVHQLRKERERAQGGSPAYRRSTGSTPKCQLQRHVTHYVRIGSSQNQPGAENAMGEAENSTVKRTISAAGRRRIVAAQRTRWARVRARKWPNGLDSLECERQGVVWKCRASYETQSS